LNRFKMALPAALLLLPALSFAGWVSQNSGTTNGLWGVHFPVNAQTGYVVGGDPNSSSNSILKTTDSGANWVNQNPGVTDYLWNVHFPVDDQTGYVLGGWNN
jgi:photosystem II stability/assembly factor-like uncharacterized protein